MTGKPWNVCVLTLFPEMFPGPLGHSLAGKALETGIWNLETVNIRDFAHDRHRTVDDTPFGGGAGMVMRPDVLEEAFLKGAPKGRRIYLSPRGRLLTQDLVKELATEEQLVLLCGRYEGVDERVFEACDIEEVSVGDYVLSGGEPAAMILMDACIRLLPGVLGNAETPNEESFEDGLLEYPHYTRPAEWTDASGTLRPVPEILLSGHHANIKSWRRSYAEKITRERRPDLWQNHSNKTTTER